MDYREIYKEWLDNPYFDDATKAELKAIADDEKEIEERFYMDLEFGTAGLRGIIGAGTNRMNVYTVRKATQGLANYIASVGGQAKGVAIAYDSRRMSPEFADEAALCLAANGIKAYVFESLRPTPELSYAVRRLGCIAGINITASHNPPEYNGYKVYWEDGAQITPPHDKGIMDEVKKVTDYATVKTMPKDKAQEAGLYAVIGADIDDPLWAKSWVSPMSPRDTQRPPSWQNKNGPKRGHVHITKLGLTRLMPSYLAKVAPVHNLPSLEALARGTTIDPVRTFP